MISPYRLFKAVWNGRFVWVVANSPEKAGQAATVYFDAPNGDIIRVYDMLGSILVLAGATVAGESIEVRTALDGTQLQ